MDSKKKKSIRIDEPYVRVADLSALGMEEWEGMDCNVISSEVMAMIMID